MCAIFRELIRILKHTNSQLEFYYVFLFVIYSPTCVGQ